MKRMFLFMSLIIVFVGSPVCAMFCPLHEAVQEDPVRQTELEELLRAGADITQTDR